MDAHKYHHSGGKENVERSPIENCACNFYFECTYSALAVFNLNTILVGSLLKHKEVFACKKVEVILTVGNGDQGKLAF